MYRKGDFHILTDLPDKTTSSPSAVGVFYDLSYVLKKKKSVVIDSEPCATCV